MLRAKFEYLCFKPYKKLLHMKTSVLCKVYLKNFYEFNLYRTEHLLKVNLLSLQNLWKKNKKLWNNISTKKILFIK